MELWQQTHDFLHKEGFQSRKFAFMISQNPKLLTTPHEKLLTSINDWRSFHFGEKNTIVLLERYPELLLLQNSSDLIMKIATIKDFVGGGSCVYKVLLNSPAAVTQSLPSLNEKIDYLHTIMKVEPADVYNSEALAAEILTIKTRHNFLKRLGLYVVKKKKDPNEISKNPKLHHITDTSDKRFATKICHVTLDEYETFQELYKKELEDEDENEASSDDENYDGKEQRIAMDWEK